MIEIKKQDDFFYVKFTGKKHEFDNFISTLMDLEPEGYSLEHRSWYFDSETIKEVRKAFQVPEPPSAIPASKKTNISPSLYADVGTGMKLQPYDYQKEGIYNAIKKKEMLAILPCGSGKTPLGIGTYMELREQGKITGPGMIVVKASLKVQWDREIAKFSNFKSRIIESFRESTDRTLAKIKRREAHLKKAEKEKNSKRVRELEKEILKLKKEANELFLSQFKDADLFVMNYETLRDEKVRNALKNAGVEFIMADEIHYVKNRQSIRSKAMAEFSDVPYKLGATATPIGKNPEDLFGIFRFVAPDIFPKWTQFSRKYMKYAGYGRLIGFKNIEDMRKRISGNIFVKSKEDVSSQLPSLVVSQKICSFSPSQEESNIAILEKLDELREEERRIRAKFTSEKDAINNPELMKVEALVMAYQTFAQQLAISEELLKMSESEMSKQFITGSSSSKIELLLDTVEDIVSSGEKVAIYSRFKKIQEVIKPLLEKRTGKKVARIYGEMSGEERYKEVYDNFRDDDSYAILLSSDAGAEGLNLSRTKYLIELEPAESYGIQTQRHGRIERSDSEHDTVFVYQLICENSWDENALKTISKKREFDSTIIQKR